MPDDFENDKRRKPGFIRRITKGLTQTDVPTYKTEEDEHPDKKDEHYHIPSVNSTIPILDILRRDTNPRPYQAFAESCENFPKYTIRISSIEKDFENKGKWVFALIGGLSFKEEQKVLVSTIPGFIEEEKVEQVQEDTFLSLYEYTREFQEEKYKQESKLVAAIERENEKSKPHESEPKSNY